MIIEYCIATGKCKNFKTITAWEGSEKSNTEFQFPDNSCNSDKTSLNFNLRFIFKKLPTHIEYSPFESNAKLGLLYQHQNNTKK